jgi:hypothetical protein
MFSCSVRSYDGEADEGIGSLGVEKGATITFHYARLYMGWRFIVDSGRRMVLRFISWIK